MKFKVKTISMAAGMVALFNALLSVVWTFVMSLDLMMITGSALFIFIVTYVVASITIKRFVIYRIKPIYQILLSKNIKMDELQHKDDIMDGIQDELNQWVEKNATEISSLREKERYRKEFLGDVSHELKTPIFNVQGYITTLLEGGLEDRNINRLYLERAEKSLDRLTNIVQDLEQISKLETNKLVLEKKPFDIVALTREVAQDVEMLAKKQDIKIIIGSGSGQSPVMVHADRKSISEVMSNLLSNAVKYGNEGGTVEVSYIDIFDKIMIEVADNGIGIPPESASRVFERFFRADKSRSREQGGTGLGLAIVKHILEAHGQTITLRSKVGEGTTFTFALQKSRNREFLRETER